MNFDFGNEGQTEVSEQTDPGSTEGQAVAATTDPGNAEGQAVSNETTENVSQTEATQVDNNIYQNLPEGMDSPEKVVEAYTKLQGEFSKRNDTDKSLQEKFDKYGGVDGLLRSAEMLTTNPRFQDFLKRENENQYIPQPQDGEEIDPDSQAAYKQVYEMADKISADRERKLIDKHITPLVQQNQKQFYDVLFKQMDSDPIVGEIWRDYQPEMAKNSNLIDPENLTVNKLKGLFYMAVNERGDMDKINANAYQKKLQQTKANSIDAPQTSTSETKLPEGIGLEGCFNNAIKELNYQFH